MSIIWTPSSFSIVHTRKGFGKAGAAVQWKEIRLPSSTLLEVASILVEMVTKEEVEVVIEVEFDVEVEKVGGRVSWVVPPGLVGPVLMAFSVWVPWRGDNPCL